MAEISTPSNEEIDKWADDRSGPVALFLRQKLLPVEDEGGVIFPPTYAGIGYNIDKLEDGTKIALVDSVGAQANRIEPIFLHEPYAKLVPQIDIQYGEDEQGDPKTVSLLEAGHRLGDAVVRSSKAPEEGDVHPENEPWDLAHEAKKAFEAYLDRGDATPIAKIAPTSLVFGVWDSRDTEAKLPRLVQSTIRAWDVSPLTRSAQYTPTLEYKKLDPDLGIETKEGTSEGEPVQKDKKKKDELAQRGYIHVPATEQHGGVVARGDIVREVTVNLVALRRLDGEEGQALRRYILGLSLVAAAEPPEAFLRQGCLLTPNPEHKAVWELIDRKGRRETIRLDEKVALEYAGRGAKAFGVGTNRQAVFDKKRARADAKKK